ncbi:MAG: glycine cleavage system aminomethyltransferase GcvT, partial [Myxococcales bacterium]|nr:glycine cleavage system aminomethyltransferase GcvT [Myxococcales bacterium]
CRTGYTGEDGFEFFCPADDGVTWWNTFVNAGAAPCGLGARDTLRLEMGYCLYGNDIDRSTSPLEAGLGWVTRLDKAGGFVGRDALAAQEARGLTRRLVALELDERGIPRHDFPIVAGGEVVGRVTSGNQSPTTGRAIALGYVPVALAEPGTTLSIDVRGKLKAAHVTTLPFYHPARA